MIYSVNITKKHTHQYPLHTHLHPEIMFYLSGNGYLENKANLKLPFSKNTLVVVPPRFYHGSVSNGEFVNISVEADFDIMSSFCNPDCIVLPENSNIEKLMNMILQNFSQNVNLCDALFHALEICILQCIRRPMQSEVSATVEKIKMELIENFDNPDIDTTELLCMSGYAEDYIRSKFRETTGYTPKEFLTRQRINYAKKLLEIYNTGISVEKLSEMCGFTDSIYFSKKFKLHTGVSPSEYKKAYYMNRPRKVSPKI